MWRESLRPLWPWGGLFSEVVLAVVLGVAVVCHGAWGAEDAVMKPKVQRIIGGVRAPVAFDIQAVMAAGEVGSRVEPLVDSLRFAEGPAWHPDGYLVFSDIPADRLYRWSDAGGLEILREPSHRANGNVFNPGGEMLTCETATRRLTKTLSGGGVEVVAGGYGGRRFNATNDVAWKSDGTAWFTDPTYGLGERDKEMDGQYVYRVDVVGGGVERVAGGYDQPNGICFSPDERRLYVSDSGRPSHVMVYDVEGAGLGDGRVFAGIGAGSPDGMACDAQGNLYVAAGDGVHVYTPDGVLKVLIPVPKTPSNVCFGGDRGDTLFITARNALYYLRMPRAIRDDGVGMAEGGE